MVIVELFVWILWLITIICIIISYKKNLLNLIYVASVIVLVRNILPLMNLDGRLS
jgi:hypothetical protein